MGFFDEVKESVTKSGQDTLQKAKDMLTVSRLNSQMKEMENRIDEYYLEAGRLIIETYTEAAHEGENIQELVIERDLLDTLMVFAEEVNKTKLEILDIQDQSRALRGLINCPYCGQEIENNALYCQFCGSKIELKTDGKKTCKECGAILPEDALFCPDCGRILREDEKKVCPKCGNEVGEDEIFCSECGYRLEMKK